MEAKIQKYKWDDLNLKKLSLNVNHFTDSIFFEILYQSGISTVPAGTGTVTFLWRLLEPYKFLTTKTNTLRSCVWYDIYRT